MPGPTRDDKAIATRDGHATRTGLDQRRPCPQALGLVVATAVACIAALLALLLGGIHHQPAIPTGVDQPAAPTTPHPQPTPDRPATPMASAQPAAPTHVPPTEPIPATSAGHGPEVTPPGAAGPVEQVMVQPGDSLWSISEENLAAQLGRDPDLGETARHWHQTIDRNLHTLRSGNPDLIYPGEQVTVPGLPRPPGPSGQPPQTPAPARSEPEPPPPQYETPTSTPASPPPPTTEPAGPPTATSAPGSREVPTTTTPPPTIGPDGPADDSPARGIGDVLLPAGISAALATVTLRALARRRPSPRQTARPSTTTEPRPTEDINAERTLAAASTDVRERAWRAAAALEDSLGSLPAPPTAVGLVVRPNGDTAVHLSEQATPPHPFVADGDPTVWVLPNDRTQYPTTRDPTRPVLETVVTIGRSDDGSWVFLDLESLGATWIDGDPTQAARLARSIAADLRLHATDHYIDLTVTGGMRPPSITEHQSVMVVDHLDETTVRQLQHNADEIHAYLSAHGLTTTHSGRVHGLPRDGLAVTVVVANQGTDPVLLDRLANAALPGGNGLALLALDPLKDPATQLLVDHDGTLHLPHLGITATAAGPDDDELHQPDDLPPREPETVVAAHRPAGEKPTPPPMPPSWTYQVRLFADHRVETPDGTSVSFRFGDPGVPNKNTARGPELLSYLALKPDRSASLDEIRDHLWWGKPISRRTADTLISGTRRRLGGGATHITYAEGEHGYKRYTLQPTVVTDLDLLEHDLACAQAVADEHPDEAAQRLRQRLASIESPAFHEDAPGAGLADWAEANRVIDRIQQPVIDAALLAADLYTSQGPIGRPNARWAIDQALKACPDNEPLTRAAMALDALSGQREAAHTRYIALAHTLARDELEPEQETTELHRLVTRSSPQIG